MHGILGSFAVSCVLIVHKQNHPWLEFYHFILAEFEDFLQPKGTFLQHKPWTGAGVSV